MRFAHCSDLHLAALEGIRLRDLLGKRLVGYSSWHGGRKRRHRTEILTSLAADLKAQRPDHVLVTGDLTNLGLPREYRRARAFLEALGSPQAVTVVPGNHDAYVATPFATTLAQWWPYLRGDKAPATPPDAGGLAAFPSLRIRANLAFIGLSSARPAPVGFATGAIGQPQLQALETLLQDTRAKGLVRILHLHHPPLAGAVAFHKRLVDAAALRQCLARAGVELVLHGHAHRFSVETLATATGIAPVVGIASASASHSAGPHRAQYGLYQLEATGHSLTFTPRHLTPEGHWQPGEVHRFSLPIPQGSHRPRDGGGRRPTG